MSYYKYFDEMTNNGRVFTSDLSALQKLPTKHLIAPEMDERNEWRNTISAVQGHYKTIPRPQVTTTELLLQQRVMVPNLDAVDVSSRSQLNETRDGRRYPHTIAAWNGFPQLVAGFQPPHRDLDPLDFDIFQFSSSLTDEDMSFSDEKGEEGYMMNVLKKSLMKARLLGRITSRGGVGKPDALTLKTNDNTSIASSGDIGLVTEFKSTHKLPLPATAAGVVEAYNGAYRHVITERGGRSATWARMCHPIGQLLGYMVENGGRYGVLASATRAYFITIQGDADAVVKISDAFFVGQPNFLRAWAYAHSLACQESETLVASSLSWKLTSGKQSTPPGKSSYNGTLRNTGITEGEEAQAMDENENVQQQHSADAPSDETPSGLVEVLIEDVEIIGTLGYGHNGVVHLARWGGEEIALKQFDVGKDGYEYFDKEIAAYLALEGAWGKLVVTPLFVSESWSGWIKFIGLQLGRDPGPDDDTSDWSKVLSSLEAQYGFRHEDAFERNMVYVYDKAMRCERLVAIDLEAHTMIPTVPPY